MTTHKSSKQRDHIRLAVLITATENIIPNSCCRGNMLLLFNIVQKTFQNFWIYTTCTLAWVSFFVTLAFSLGWTRRLLWFLAEQELRKILNGTPVTIGSVEFDLLRGKAWFSNVIVHSPRKDVWQWESPILARIGKLHVETNLAWAIIREWIFFDPIPLEVPLLHLSDVQAFVERRQNIFNFHLLDDKNIIPDPKIERKIQDKEDIPSIAMEESWDLPVDDSNPKTQQIVEDLVQAMFSVGKAAQEGDLQGVLAEHRHTLKSKLKELRGRNKSEAVQEGVKIVQEVSKAVVETTQNVQQSVNPARKDAVDDEPEVYARFGRVVIEDFRIFTRDHFGTKTSTWNKPIFLQRVIVRASEFCPSFSAFDERGFPALYQPMDKVIDILIKRILAEMAKTNSGRLFQTALGEMMDMMETTSNAGDSQVMT